MSNYFGYMRISTEEKKDVQSFTRQKEGLETYAQEEGIEYTLILQDDKTGGTFSRPEWKKLERLAQEGDTIVFKELSRFTREAEKGYQKYMELYNKGVHLVFIDNPTVSTDYISNLTQVAEGSDTVVKTALEGTIKLLIMVEMDRVEKEREIIRKRIKQGMAASSKKAGRRENQLIKMTDELKADIKEYLGNREIKQVDLMKKHDISRNTLKKYVEIVRRETA